MRNSGGMIGQRVKSSRRLLLFGILLVFLMVGFFIPARLGWPGILVKSLLFCLLLVFLHRLIFSSDPRPVETGVQDRGAADEETTAALEEGAGDQGWSGFGPAFNEFVSTFLGVVRHAVMGSSAAFYLKKGDGFVFNMGETGDGAFDKHLPIPKEDILYRVLAGPGPIVDGRLHPGARLPGLPSDIRSIMAVPLCLDGDVKGILAVGSEVVECFGEEDVGFLERNGDLLVQVMRLCQRGRSGEVSLAVQGIQGRMEGALLEAGSPDEAVSVFVDHVKALLPFHRLTVCFRDGEEAEIRYVYGQVDHADCGLRFKLDDGLNGWIMRRGQALVLGDIEQGDRIRPRYSRGEDTRHGLRSFLGIPLRRGERAWGAITLESRDVNQYGDREKAALMRLIPPFQVSLELFRIKEGVSGTQPADPSSSL